MLGIPYPFQSVNIKSRIPPVRNLRQETIIGGSTSMAYFMPKKVEPQTTYTSPSAIISLVL
jgi:hypothetical protein